MDKIYKRAQRRAGMTVAETPMVIIVAIVIAFALLFAVHKFFGTQGFFIELLFVLAVFFIGELAAFLVGWYASKAYLFMVNSDGMYRTRKTILHLRKNPVPKDSPLYEQYEALLKMYELRFNDLAAEKGRLMMSFKSQF